MRPIPAHILLLPLAACQSLPDLNAREPSIYIPTARAPALERALSLPENDGGTLPPPDAASPRPAEPVFLSDAYIIDRPDDAFAARAQLIDHAAVSIDAQYYIWHNDTSGRLLLHKLWQAAERGVRVRLLLDDNNTRGMDGILSALNAHPNVQIRLFNPFLHRRWRALGYLADFPRVNRRMHNKSLTADNRASIIGGRNIGDEYLHTAHTETTFADMDVLVSGSIATRISQEFDRYWQSHSAYPLESIVRRPPSAQDEGSLKQDCAQIPRCRTYLDSVASAPGFQVASGRKLPFVRAEMQLASDDPAKALDRKVRVNIRDEIQKAMGTPEYELYLASAYFVPTRAGISVMQSLRNAGIKTTLLTNSLAATDVAAVHSGYMRYRKPLLHAGVSLYELKAENAPPPSKDKGLTGSSSTSLHAKTFIADQERVFVGSFNLDPRSARLNTEMGIVIRSPEFAADMQQRLENEARRHAYRVTLSPRGHLQWHDPARPDSPPAAKEPDAPLWKRALSRFLSWLPIERLL